MEATNTAPATETAGIVYEVIPFRAKGDAEGFSFTTKTYLKITRAASSTSGRAKNQIPISSTAPRWFNYQLDCNSYEI